MFGAYFAARCKEFPLCSALYENTSVHYVECACYNPTAPQKSDSPFDLRHQRSVSSSYTQDWTADVSVRCLISCMFYLGVPFYHDVTGCTLGAFTYECTYLRTMLKRNDNSAIFFLVSGSLFYHMQARSVTVKTRRASSRTKTKTATNRRTHLQEISFHMTGV